MYGRAPGGAGAVPRRPGSDRLTMPHTAPATTDGANRSAIAPTPAPDPLLPPPANAVSSTRLGLIDAIRGFAILGIFWRNIFVFGMPYLAYAMPGIVVPEVAGDLIAQIIVAVFVEGTMRALVSIVFGASALIIMTAKAPAHDSLAPFDRYYRRLLWLVAIGLVHGYVLLWPHDILFTYGVLAMTLFPFRRMKPLSLALIAAALLLGSTVIEGSGWRQVGDATGKVEAIEERHGRLFDERGTNTRGVQLAQLEGGDSDGDAASDGDGESLPSGGLDADDVPPEVIEAIAEEIVGRLGGYGENFRALARETFEQQTSELLIHHVFDIGSMLFLGMALLKWGVLSGAVALSVYRRLAIGGLASGLLFGVLAHDTLIGFEPLLAFSETYGGWFFDVRRCAFALSVVGFMGWLYHSRHGWVRIFEAPGRLALTLYIMQTVVAITVFYGFGLSFFASFGHAALLGLALAFSVIQLAFAHVWIVRFGQGPMERLLGHLIALGGREPAPVATDGPDGSADRRHPWDRRDH